MAIRIKRSMSPDGKIDSVTVELEIEAEVTDTQAVLDAIAITDTYAAAVAEKAPLPRSTNDGGHVTNNGGQLVVEGVPKAVFDGEPSKVSGKMGPGAVLIDGIKVKSFDKDFIAKARNAKNNGQTIRVGYVSNDKWKSNDAKTLEVL